MADPSLPCKQQQAPAPSSRKLTSEVISPILPPTPPPRMKAEEAHCKQHLSASFLCGVELGRGREMAIKSWGRVKRQRGDGVAAREKEVGIGLYTPS